MVLDGLRFCCTRYSGVDMGMDLYQLRMLPYEHDVACALTRRSGNWHLGPHLDIAGNSSAREQHT